MYNVNDALAALHKLLAIPALFIISATLNWKLKRTKTRHRAGKCHGHFRSSETAGQSHANGIRVVVTITDC